LARKNRLASAAAKQDDSEVHHATAANGSQDVSIAPAPLAGPGAEEAAASQPNEGPLRVSLREAVLGFGALSHREPESQRAFPIC